MDHSNVSLASGLNVCVRSGGIRRDSIAPPPLFKVVQRLAAGVLVLLLAAGCTTYRDQTGSMRAQWEQGQFAEAAATFEKRANKKDDGKDSVIWQLEAGAALRAVGRFDDSNRYLDHAAVQIDAFEEKAKVRVGSQVAATMSNQQSLPYEGRSYDKIMLHTYKALNYLALGDVEKARPELIRAYQRQQDAVAANARRIASAQEEQEASDQREAVERARHDPKFNAQLEELRANLEGFDVYANYVNPFTVLLDGIYFLHAGGGSSDRERAIKSLNRVSEIVPESSSIRSDLDAMSDPLTFNPSESTTYVIFETGRGATRDEVRIDVPIIFADVSYVGAAFPKLEFHGNYCPTLSVTAGEAQRTTERVASMDSIVALDFENEWPVILTRTLIATAAKGAAAYGINTAARREDDVLGLLARVSTAIYQAAVNIADTRAWSTLPKEFQFTRIPTPEDRRVIVSTALGQSQEITLLDGSVNVIYVRSVSTSSPLLVSQFILK